MASTVNNTPDRVQLLHVGFMVPLNELMFESENLERELGHLNLRSNVYSAALFYKSSNQDSLHAWFNQRKQSSRMGYLRAYYLNKRRDAIIEMDVDGKQFYLVASAATSQSPNEMKKDISRGLFGERKVFADRIQVACFPYKCDVQAGFIPCAAFLDFQKEYSAKKDALNAAKDENITVT